MVLHCRFWVLEATLLRDVPRHCSAMEGVVGPSVESTQTCTHQNPTCRWCTKSAPLGTNLADGRQDIITIRVFLSSVCRSVSLWAVGTEMLYFVRLSIRMGVGRL